MKGDNLTIDSRTPTIGEMAWQFALEQQTAYRAALKPTAVLPTSLDSWLRERTKEIQ